MSLLRKAVIYDRIDVQQPAGPYWFFNLDPAGSANCDGLLFIEKGYPMKAEFQQNGRNDEIVITAKDGRESEDLRRWDNCVISAKFDYTEYCKNGDPTLLLCKEI